MNDVANLRGTDTRSGEGGRPSVRAARIRLAALLAAALLSVAGGVASAGWFTDLFRSSPAEEAKAAGVTETAEEVAIPLKSLDSGRALFLVLESGGRQLYYFALKSPDGKYRAALDACDVCFRMNRGYRQEGDQMVCNNCGMKFPCDRIGEVKGGCNPHPLAFRIERGNMVIRKADILAGWEYFPRKRS
jgi:uncharacterized membrane protein